MAMGRRQECRQQQLWVEAQALAKGPGHHFYERLSKLLDEHDFDSFVKRTVYRNRRRIQGRGRDLLRRRGEKVERTFAHSYETGRMRRTHLRGHENIRKRLLIHIAGFNLGLLLRGLHGFGTPRALQGFLSAFGTGVWVIFEWLKVHLAAEIEKTEHWSLKSQISSAVLTGVD